MTIPNKFPRECGPGWNRLIDKLQKDIDAIEPGLEYTQIKEKYGTLCVYVGLVYNEKVYDLIDKAEADSGLICEHCGEPGILRGKGWYETTCETHKTQH